MRKQSWFKSGLVYGAASLALVLAACETTESKESVSDEGDTAVVDTVIVTGTTTPHEVGSAPDAAPALPSAIAAERSADFSKSAPSPSIAPPGDSRPQPEPQSGLLTAGDYDDVLNPDLYKAYLDKTLQDQGIAGRKDLPFVDAADRIAVQVTDRLGKPMPFADIELTSAQGEPMFPLRTGANGTVYLYPAFGWNPDQSLC